MTTKESNDLKFIRSIVNEVYHDLVSSNRPTHDEWSSSAVNLKKIIDLIEIIEHDNKRDNRTA